VSSNISTSSKSTLLNVGFGMFSNWNRLDNKNNNNNNRGYLASVSGMHQDVSVVCDDESVSVDSDLETIF
jgi:hypothetical protein